MMGRIMQLKSDNKEYEEIAKHLAVAMNIFNLTDEIKGGSPTKIKEVIFKKYPMSEKPSDQKVKKTIEEYVDKIDNVDVLKSPNFKLFSNKFKKAVGDVEAVEKAAAVTMYNPADVLKDMEDASKDLVDELYKKL
jgi:hypothetical protein